MGFDYASDDLKRRYEGVLSQIKEEDREKAYQYDEVDLSYVDFSAISSEEAQEVANMNVFGLTYEIARNMGAI